MYDYAEVRTDTESLQRYTALLRLVFPNATQYSAQYLAWQYAQNPNGDAVGVNAIAGDGLLAAHYVCQPLTAMVCGTEHRGLLSFNTATHPEHQGKGLFTQLANRTYDLAAKLGYSFVIGVANANSTPGFVRKLGFDLICRLDAKIGIGTPDPVSVGRSVVFERLWTNDTLAWRLRNPAGRYAVRKDTIYAATGTPLIKALLMRSTVVRDAEPVASPLVRGPVTLWIGRDPALSWRNKLFIEIPERLRPSPLNLIFKDLTGQFRNMQPDEVRFWPIDFDAY